MKVGGKKDNIDVERYKLNDRALQPRNKSNKPFKFSFHKESEDSPMPASLMISPPNVKKIQKTEENRPKPPKLTPGEKKNIMRNRKALLLCSPSNCPEIESKACSCKLFDHDVYESSFGYSDPEIFNERKKRPDKRSEYCVCLAGCKLCLTFNVLFCGCLLESCRRCRIFGCGEWASYNCTGQNCVEFTCKYGCSLLCAATNRCFS